MKKIENINVQGVANIILAIALAFVTIWLCFQVMPAEVPVPRSYSNYTWLRKEVVSVSATGAAGAAQGTAATDRDLHGYVFAVHIDYTASISTTTDITLSQASPALTIILVSDTITDAWYYPVVEQDDNAGSGTSTYEKTLVQDGIDITAGETTSGTVATVTIYWGQ